MANPYTSYFVPSARAPDATTSAPAATIASRIADRRIRFMLSSFRFATMPAPSLSMLRRVSLFPGTDVLSALIENPLVVALQDLVLCLLRELVEHRLPHVVDGVVGLRVLRRHRVGAEQEPVRVLVEELRTPLDRLRARDRVLGDLVPGDVHAQVGVGRVGEHALQHVQVM